MGWPVISSVRQVCIEGEPVTRGLGAEWAKSARLSSGVVAAVKASAKAEKTAVRQWIARIQDYALMSGETKSAHRGTRQPPLEPMFVLRTLVLARCRACAVLVGRITTKWPEKIWPALDLGFS